ncbi:TolC family outer membrane protein [Undibacterium sp.]|uniref:TolC family outer membrane protein n=1 Tax=Undibacterium sp. TaxID=1914977 RepID=UPI002BFFD146|nr:TolC family outer membrane protein [Undibacterium sp.]HTD04664.1 TolC family outer membrane protein [Undibacterium sp.]
MPNMVLRRLMAAGVSIAFLLQTHQASALGLMQAYDAALQNDPTYRGAIFENEAGQQNKILGRSSLLPSAQINWSAGKNRSILTAPDFFGKLGTSYPEYTSTDGSLQVRQVLFSLDAFARYKQGIAQSNYSGAIFSGKRQDLIVRLVSAYADAQYGEDQLALLTAQRDAFAEQRRVNDRMFEKGEATKTDMLETQAKLDLAEAQVIESQDNLVTARNTLAAIVGQEITQLDGLTDNFKVLLSASTSFDEWKKIADSNNSEILAGQYAVEAAEQEVKKNRAGHTPRLDFQAVYDKSKSNTLTTLNQDSSTKSVGIQLVIPIYSGGYVSAATSQAVAGREKAKADLDATTQKVYVELRKQYSSVLSSATKIDALVKSVKSADLLVEATKQSIKGGVRINLDLLNAHQQLATAKRDLAQARYTYIISYLRLRNAAGVLNGDDLRTVSAYFVAGN